jgi:hypothetical protein
LHFRKTFVYLGVSGNTIVDVTKDTENTN